MMEIEILSYGSVREIVGVKAIPWECADEATVEDVITSLEATFGDLEPDSEFGRTPLVIVKNGRNIALHEGRSTRLAAGDQLILSGPPMPE